MPAEIRLGMQLRIPCTAQNGAFKDEYLITIETKDGMISGFIEADAVSSDAAGNKYVLGTVREINGEIVAIRLSGSFFTTAGLARFSQRDLQGYQS